MCSKQRSYLGSDNAFLPGINILMFNVKIQMHWEHYNYFKFEPQLGRSIVSLGSQSKSKAKHSQTPSMPTAGIIKEKQT